MTTQSTTLRPILVLLAAIAAAPTASHAAAAPDRLPQQIDGLRYARAHARLRARGFAPLPLAPRDPELACDPKEARCATWPERADCSSKGDCTFFWRRLRDGRVLQVQTFETRYGDVVVSASWAVPSDLCDYKVPSGLRLKTPADAKHLGRACR